MRTIFALLLLTASAQAGYIDVAGSGGTFTYDGTTLTGTANLQFLHAFGTTHDGDLTGTGVLTVTNTTFSVFGSFGPISNEILYSGTITAFNVIHPDANEFTFILGVGSGNLAPDVASYFGLTPLQQAGLSITIDGVQSTHFVNGFDSSTDLTIGVLTNAVPEPSSILLVGMGLTAFGVYRRKK